VVAAAVMITRFALPKLHPKPRPAGLDQAGLAADQALGAPLPTGDRARARRPLTLPFTYVAADLKIHPPREFPCGPKTAAARPATDIKIGNFGSLAMMTGKHTSAQGSDVFFLDVWVKQKGAWRALLMQDVPFRAGEDAALRPIQISDLDA